VTTEPTDQTRQAGNAAPATPEGQATETATPADIAAKPTAAKKAAVKNAAVKKAAVKKAAVKKAAAKQPAARKSASKATSKSASKSASKKPPSKTSTATRAAAVKAAGSTPAEKVSAPTTAATKASAREASQPRSGGAFAAGAARASGERRRRSGTPLLPTQPVEVSHARHRSVGAASTTPPDEPVEVTDTPVSVDAPGEQPDDSSLGTTATSDVPAAAAASPSTSGAGRRPGTSEPADTPTTPTAPTTRARPSRASMRSTRRTANGEPTRLRAVPRVPEPAATPGDAGAPGAGRHTQAGGDGWEHALTSGLQSRAEKLVGAVLEGAEFTSESRPGPAELVELAINVLRAAATSAGVPAEDVERQVAETLAYLRRRLSGDYVVDEFGFDEDYTINVHLPLLRPLYKKWFRVEVRGIENIPDEGGALVVGNHSGTVAMDSLMTQVAVYDEHPKKRHLRMLGADLVFQMPFIGTMARRSGTTLAANTDAERLLAGGSLVGVWPEGFKGVGKPFSERYKLQRFGRGGFVSAALRAGVPIVPVSIVGAEEIYPILGNMPAVARLLGLPYAPITPTFPLLGPLGMVPLPSKWLIEFGPPIDTSAFGPEAADDPMLVFDLTDQVRETIQQTLYSLLMQRKSVFL
jgi:1-acyl-sn-glycerol-3-phosphate acyltransferase